MIQVRAGKGLVVFLSEPEQASFLVHRKVNLYFIRFYNLYVVHLDEKKQLSFKFKAMIFLSDSYTSMIHIIHNKSIYFFSFTEVS